jgi:hypothetical protein
MNAWLGQVPLRSRGLTLGFSESVNCPIHGQAPVAGRGSLGQTLPKGLPKDLTKEQIYELAGQTIVKTGNVIASKLNQTYEKYKDTGSYGLAEAATSFFVGGPAGPIYAAADLWWQSRRQNEAVVALESARKIAQEWVNAMTQDETGWIPLYLDGIESIDPALAEQVGNTFDKVVQEMGKVSQRLVGVKELPASVLSNFISSAWSGIKNDLTSSARFLNDLAMTLRNLLGALSEGAKGARQLSELAPMAVLLGGIGLVIALSQ